MSNLIRDHPDIEGVPVPDVGDTNLEVRLSQYADDTVLIFRNFAKSFPHMKDCIKIFCEASGMKINVDKTARRPHVRHQGAVIRPARV